MNFTLQSRPWLSVFTLLIAAIAFSLPLSAQNSRTITGSIRDQSGAFLTGATVAVKGTVIATTSDNTGTFRITVPVNTKTLIVSYVGMGEQEVNLTKQSVLDVRLSSGSSALNDVIVVGYGRQRKASVVGAISQTTGAVLERTGGVSNLGMALTGNLPGLVTTSSTGIPGGEDPQILIRAQTTWNGGGPLILVDGVERPGALGTIDITSVESVSILKDASATAVYGVKGANGVILITTKRGVAGKPSIRIRSNMTMKVASKLPKKYDAYDGLALKNEVIERELMATTAGWTSYKPQEILNKYRFPANEAEWDRYPNVDWEKELFRSNAKSYNTSANISGGSNFVTYFAAIDFVSEGDLFKTFQNGRGYNSGYGYTRTNVRSNLDFNLTKTTKFTTRLFGSNGVRQGPWGGLDGEAAYWASAYRTSPDALRPIYSDGTWGWFAPRNADVPNSVYNLAISGIEKRTTAQLTTDFVLQQDLSVLLKGLDFRGSLSLDNSFRENGRGINDQFNGPQRKWIDPETGVVTLETPINTGTQLDYFDPVRWLNQAGSVDRGQTYRRSNYQIQLNYANKFGKHDVTGLALLQRERYARGGEFPWFREDWVFRATYNYDSRFPVEVNGAYNGSAKFGPDYRFAFFPSFSAGWMLSNENFMKNVDFINLLKFRGSWGRVGDDNGGDRFAYSNQLSFGGNTQMGSPLANTPYSFFRITRLGNPNLSWETVEKRNIGVDYSLFKGKISGSVDVFRDDRSRIIIAGNQRAIPTYFGVAAPQANLGRVKGKGYEIELRLNHTFGKAIRVYANTNMTHAENRTIFRDDPELLPAYQKNAGQMLGQYRSYLDYGFLQTWDDIYGTAQRATNDQNKLPGDYKIIDFNGDGIIDQYDLAPHQYSGSPQNTYNATIGLDWKGLSFFVQFYAVNNVTRQVRFPTFDTYPNSNVAFVEGSFWTKGEGGEKPMPRWSTLYPAGGDGTRFVYDGSYVRLKNAELGYTLSGRTINKLGMKSMKIYVNGNNLLLWTRMPDDRESNFSGAGDGGNGAYPTVRRFNLGLDVNL
ncbi:SusC/RagA family TonB-linked outer membrane protein [Segetibacter sp. 3557_3]|uniref:SusC/RagA family TonB-linked outer membrane protein n=1 Tax=Segetibacter sp. 3557_3 TaxID=2547429 RepID=UPI001058838B|nr:SusC/RagA family TonB-linked outer membrane protein [Segetibacter sp. 3557_3]TDH23501.1 SusC/RagA family TonB-linked outer membrane protein [Segetibacter sp. 3557_3]